MYKKFRSIFTLILGIVAVGLFQSTNADYSISIGGVSEDDPQDILISLKSNPMSNPEAACLAVTFARMLSANVDTNVTLFVTLDGVSLADESVVSSRRFKCDTPWGEISLKENLEHFIDINDYDNPPLPESSKNMVVCPLCWKSRYGDELPNYGILSGAAIEPMMLNADKILDF